MTRRSALDVQSPTFLVLLLFASLAHAQSFFPNTPGTTWEYIQSGAELNRITVRVLSRETSNGKDVFKLETSAADQLIKSEIYTSDKRGVLCLERTAGEGPAVVFEPPRIILPIPFRVGTAWDVEEEVGENTLHQQFKIVSEDNVVVQAGTFRAYHLHCDQPWPISVAVDRWYSPGTGFIKEIVTTHGPTGRLISRVEQNLTRFTPATAAPIQSPSPSPSVSPGPTASPMATPSIPPASPAPSVSPPSSAGSPPVTLSPAPTPTITLEVAKESGGEPTTTFKSDALNIYVRWHGTNLSAGSTVRVAWIAEDVGDIVDSNFVVDETETEVTNSEFGAHFTLSRPEDGWAAGKYRVELYLDDDLAAKVSVEIKD